MPSDYEDLPTRRSYGKVGGNLPTLKSSYGEAGEEIGKGKGARP